MTLIVFGFVSAMVLHADQNTPPFEVKYEIQATMLLTTSTTFQIDLAFSEKPVNTVMIGNEVRYTFAVGTKMAALWDDEWVSYLLLSSETEYAVAIIPPLSGYILELTDALIDEGWLSVGFDNVPIEHISVRGSTPPRVIYLRVGEVSISENTVTVNGSQLPAGTAAGQSGAGTYQAGAVVTIHAGTRQGYNFTGWTVNSGGVTLTSPSTPTAAFTMPSENVTVTADWAVISPANLVSITNPQSVTRPNGSAVTVSELGLPATVAIVTTEGTLQADVKWNLNGLNYNPQSTFAQTFTVTGEIDLPSLISNPNNVSLDVTISVTVRGVTFASAVFYGIDHPWHISGIPSGTNSSARALGLPLTVRIFTSEGSRWADVNWRMSNLSYNPLISDTQTFNVSGTIALPVGVSNPDNVPLTTSIRVTVEEANFWWHHGWNTPISVPQPGNAPSSAPVISPVPSPAVQLPPVQPLHTTTTPFVQFTPSTIVHPEPDIINISAMLNGRRIHFSGQSPVVAFGDTYIPVRETFERLGFTLEWDSNTRTATLRRNRTVVTLTDGSSSYTINGAVHRHDGGNTTQIINGTLMVPFVQVLRSIDVTAHRDANNVLHMNQT
jgi:uncharacterized repeat protein (TIGR02543 family)